MLLIENRKTNNTCNFIGKWHSFKKVVMASGYDFPIFVSSTDYNLVDLRAELQDHLDGLGYRVVLSSSDGFPDQTPNFTPWESCLPVLDKCHVVILIVDGRYGSPMEWPNFKEIIGPEKISPTHGEYRFAKKKGKRTLIFIRGGLMNDYQRYREALKTEAADVATEAMAKIKEKLFLPITIDFDVLKFIHEIKTEKPIQWIRTFKDVTEVKRAVHSQLLNELAMSFIDRQGELIARFSKALDSCDPEERKKILKRIGYTNELIEDIEKKATDIADLKNQINQKQKEVEILALEKTKNRKKIDELETDMADLGMRVNDLQEENTLTLSGTAYAPTPSGFAGLGASFLQYDSAEQVGNRTCDQCKNRLPIALLYNNSQCPKCKRTLCHKCFGASIFSGLCAQCGAYGATSDYLAP
ncbi:MAG: DUF4062 domain-containing protein [Verrucomicrobia bacterium]|nr:DUF4062 domain-containing protein [Verrucomicrobiota bacterium]